jgi:hypothetical protein
MRRVLLLGLLAGGWLLADIVTLKDGGQISGSVESGNTQELHVKVEDRSQTIDIHQVRTIQFGVSLASPPPTKAADLTAGAAEPEPAQPNSLILKDGTKVAGRWWSVDAADVHFLVDNQLQHYALSGVLGVTFGNAALPPPPARSTTPPATSAPPPPPANPVQPAPAPKLARSSSSPPPQPSTPTRPAGNAPSSAPSRGLSQPDEIGMVYSWDGKVVTPLEHNRAVEHKSGANPYWEIPAPQSKMRLSEAATLVFVVCLPQGVDPASYSLFPLDTVNGGRRTRSQSGHRGGLMTWPVDIVKNSDASIVTYVLTVRDLPTGEYSFSPSTSNDGYCFGIDPAAPGQ